MYCLLTSSVDFDTELIVGFHGVYTSKKNFLVKKTSKNLNLHSNHIVYLKKDFRDEYFFGIFFCLPLFNQCFFLNWLKI